MKKIYVQFECSPKTMLNELTNIIRVMEKNFKDLVEYGCYVSDKQEHLSVTLEIAEPHTFFRKFRV